MRKFDKIKHHDDDCCCEPCLFLATWWVDLPVEFLYSEHTVVKETSGWKVIGPDAGSWLSVDIQQAIRTIDEI